MPRNNARRYLNLRGNKWWFKRDIPTAIRAVIGRGTAYLVNLETSDVRVAQQRRDDLERETDRLFGDARAGRPLTANNGDDLKRSAEKWALELAASRANPEDWHEKATGYRPPEDERGALSLIGPEEMIEGEAEQIARSHGEAASQRFLNIVHGRVEIDHHLADYLREAGLATKTTKERNGLVRMFSTWAKEKGWALADVSRTNAGKYVTAALVPRDRRTAGKHLTALSRYWDYLIRRGHVAGECPWKGQLLPENKKRVERGDGKQDERPFTKAEMQLLLYPPAPSKAQRADWQLMQDVMRTAALSGMRQAEIITLWASDITFGSDGAATFDLQQGKNGNAAREVPAHPQLLEIVNRRLKGRSGSDALFPELSDSDNPADAFGKRFKTYREGRGVKDIVPGKRRSLVNFHSFRKWFITQAERAGFQESTIASVAGHEKGRQSITFKVYSDGPSEDQKRKCVEAVALPDAGTSG